jgi:heparan-alpha-glucosaminide N-acetyltransferase
MVILLHTSSTSGITSPNQREMTAPQHQRIASIDIIRALTMVLMIFVNDLWSLQHIPHWLEHTAAEDDGMGLADAVFPAFLFIVGMSIPFAIQNRRKKGESNIEIIGHILLRSGAMLVMGLFLVNGEYINANATGLPRLLWNVLCCTAFILIWNSYPSAWSNKKIWALRVAGTAILATLAILYRGGESQNLVGFSTFWWGILGLIGWAYLISGIVFVLAGKRFTTILLVWMFFHWFCVMSHAGWISSDWIKTLINPIGDGAMPALTMGGVVISMIYLHYRETSKQWKMMAAFLGIATLLLVLGFCTHTIWDISKIRATPPWILLCSAITIYIFTIIYWLADINGKAHWFNFVKPAGTNTLLCYLIPHFAYAVVIVSLVRYPDIMLTGTIGLMKSFLFALLVVWIAGRMGKRGIVLKL